MHAPNFPYQRFSGFNAAAAHFNTCSALLPLPLSAIAEGAAVKTIKAISVVVKSVLSLFMMDSLLPSYRQPGDLGSFGEWTVASRRKRGPVALRLQL